MPSFTQGVSKYVKEQTSWDSPLLKYLLDFLAMKNVWVNLNSNTPILSLAVQTWTIFEKLLNELIDKHKQYGEQKMDNYLENISKECDASYSFFEEYQKNNNDRLERLKCEEGAKKLKDFVEKIRQEIRQG